MQISCFTVGPFAENTYLLTKGGDALIVDPGFAEESEYNKVKAAIIDGEYTLKAVVLTHAHVDHVLGLHRVLNDFEVPVFLNDRDRYLWNNFAPQAAMFGFKEDEFTITPEPLSEQLEWSIGNFTFEIRYTPGHSPDHVSLYSASDEIVLGGDVLFREGIGRTDLYKGNFEVLKKSIRQQLYSLPDNTTVFPGHGPETTIGYEKKANPFVKDG